MSATSTPAPTTITITASDSIAAQNRGPVTTAFSPPASCAATATINAAGGLYLGHLGTFGSEAFFDIYCYPFGTKDALQMSTIDWFAYHYSPAACPVGWAIATRFTSSSPVYPNFGVTSFVAIGSETTAALCCPSGYSHTQYGHLCVSSVTQGQTLVVRSPSQVGQAWQLGSATTSIATKATYIEGDGVPIWWQNSDSSVLAQASATTTSMTSGASPSPSSTGTTSTPDSGLSSGTKIGLGVGLAIAGVLLGLLALFFVRKRRREHAEAERHGLLPAGETKHESNATEIYQLDATPPSHELFNSGEAWHQRHELPGAPKK